MSLCRPARCGCAFASSTLDITQTASGVVTIESPDAAASAWPIRTFLNVAELVATITSPQEGMEAWLRSTNQKVRYNGTGWLLVGHPRTNYTPTLLDITLGSGGLNLGSYWVSEDTCHVRTHLKLGSGGAFVVSGQARLGIPPIEPARPASMRLIGNSHYYDQSAARIYAASNEIDFQDNIVLYSPGDLAQFGVHASSPFTWATQDEVWLIIDYAHAEYLA